MVEATGERSQRVVVTGCAGFIGRHLTRALHRHGAVVVGLDLLSGGGAVRIDIRQPLPAEVFDGSDTVIHLAALAGVRESIKRPDEYHVTNVVGTKNTLDAALRAGVRHFVLVSSSAVYGECTRPADENAVLRPLSPYGASKATAEDTVVGYAGELHVTVARPFTVFGPDQRGDMLIARLLRGEKLTVWNFERDFTPVDYVVTGLVATANRPPDDSSARILNLASGSPQSVGRVLREIGKIRNAEVDVRWGSRPMYEPRRTWANTARARGLLGLDDPRPFSSVLREQSSRTLPAE